MKTCKFFLDFLLVKEKLLPNHLCCVVEKVLRSMLEEGPPGFKGGMSASKYISLTKASKATATRGLQQLVELGALSVIGGGRSTRYKIRW